MGVECGEMTADKRSDELGPKCDWVCRQLMAENLPPNARDTGWIPEPGRPPGAGSGNRPSVLAWRVPGTEEPGGLPSTGPQRVRHDCGSPRRTEGPFREALGRVTFFSFLGSFQGHFEQ